MTFKAPIATAVAIAVGLTVLSGYFFLPDGLRALQSLLLNWGITLAGVAALVGVIHLLGVHWRRLGARQDRDFTSIIFLVAFTVTVAAGIWYTPADPIFQQLVLAIQVPIEISLLALLAVTLPAAILRMLRHRIGLMPIIFLFSVLFFLVLRGGLLTGAQMQGYHEIFHIVDLIPLTGGRGILLGVALGSMVTGLRVLFGVDRPYSG